jgi:Tfp pilus assembly PilM family ATPase
MFKKKGTCVIEYAQDSIRVTAVNKSVQHQAIAIVQGQEEDAAKKLASFLRQNRVARIVALSPRTSCLVATFRLPSNDHDELLKMVEFQFSRSSPYKKEDLLVDVRILEAVPPGKSLVSGAMMVRDRLTPFLEILKKAGITPDVITPNSQRLLPLAKIIWENFFIAEGKILWLWLNGTFSLSLFVKGDIYFSREESQSSGNTINAFIEYCHLRFL